MGISLALGAFLGGLIVAGSEFRHQALADMLTLRERLGPLPGRTLTYVGDGNNVAHSLLYGCAKVGMHLSLAVPEGFDPDEKVLAEARADAEATGAELISTYDTVANGFLVRATRAQVEALSRAAGVEALRFRSTAPPDTGVLLDDLGAGALLLVPAAHATGGDLVWFFQGPEDVLCSAERTHLFAEDLFVSVVIAD